MTEVHLNARLSEILDTRPYIQKITLTHLPLHKMAAILAENILNCIFF